MLMVTVVIKLQMKNVPIMTLAVLRVGNKEYCGGEQVSKTVIMKKL